MSKEISLISGFSGIESEKIRIHLNKLLPHLKPDDFVVVGGLAIRYHLISRGIPYPQRPFNDLDLIVKSPNVVFPSVSKDFLICHHHTDDFYLALVDPISKTKVDIFSYDPAPKRLERVSLDNRHINVVSVEDQLVKTVLDIQRISSEAHVDPKQFFDTKLLVQISDLQRANKVWQSHKFKEYPSDIEEAIGRAEKIAVDHPEWVEEKPFRKPKPYACTSCCSTNDFEIVPMEVVYKALGYIE